MSETKRGCPTEDGVYVCKLATYHLDQLIRRSNGLFDTFGGCAVRAGDILAHRPHVPLEVPPLKELSLCVGKPCVVLIQNRPALAEKFRWSNDVTYLVHQPNTHWAPDKYTCKLTELTRSECEAAGYLWPLES